MDSQSNQNIAIIGLGRIGSAFLTEMMKKKSGGIHLTHVAEIMDTPGKAQAVAAGIAVVGLDDLVALGDKLDVIFDLSGLPEVRNELRHKLAAAGNHHTIIASETIARLIWALISDHALPVIEGRKTGY
ncbi:homoserine dehydrogenase [Janthinobacterium sp. BJB412]|nr:homoserine dehydrogenase [Janthinobacterium sp. BJB412]